MRVLMITGRYTEELSRLGNIYTNAKDGVKE
jgi:hypothetical protein